jgi:putative Holliday junction resolvase
MAALSGTILAFDFGLKRIGVAVGNTVLRQAEALSIIDAASNEQKFIALEKLIRAWQPVLCVVGLPLHPDGNAHAMTQRCQRFAHQLEGRFGVQTALVDERYSSAVLTHQRGVAIDDQAAALILQQYFDQTGPSS